MRILSIHLTNFASYEELNFDFKEQGLTLIQGATGSGKSTLCDAVPWVLLGSTAKGGSVDEILRWGSKAPTTGTIYLQTPAHGNLLITRTRGNKNNDLFYCRGAQIEVAIRGKDLNDTQKQINQLLGLTPDLYLAGAYYHEFSQTAQFFTTTAKNRRTLCEQIVDLSLAKKIQESAGSLKKTKSKQVDTANLEILVLKSQISTLENSYKDNHEQSKNWEINAARKVQELRDKQANYQTQLQTELENAREYLTIQTATAVALNYDPRIRAEILDELHHLREAGAEVCESCGARVQHQRVDELTDQSNEQVSLMMKYAAITKSMDSAMRTIEHLKSNKPDFENQIKTLLSYKNPLIEANLRVDKQLIAARTNLDIIVTNNQKASQDLADVETLLDIVDAYRSETVKSTIQELETRTNALLDAHFDGEIKVVFEVEDADKLDVTILKDGHNCVYTQLSKGQRQLLKLCFGVSVMEVVANSNGLSFNCIFLDEAFDGLDDNFKVKAFGLLQTMALDHENVFVVEHNEAIKSLFIKKYLVSLNNGTSAIEEA